MFVLIAVGISTGLFAAVVLAPVSFLAALIIAPLVSSAAAILACFVIAWRNTAETGTRLQLDAQTDAMVFALRDVAQKATAVPPAPRVGSSRRSAVKAG